MDKPDSLDSSFLVVGQSSASSNGILALIFDSCNKLDDSRIHSQTSSQDLQHEARAIAFGVDQDSHNTLSWDLISEMQSMTPCRLLSLSPSPSYETLTNIEEVVSSTPSKKSNLIFWICTAGLVTIGAFSNRTFLYGIFNRGVVALLFRSLVRFP